MPTVFGNESVTGTLSSTGQLSSAGGLVVSGTLGGLATPTIASVTTVGATGSTSYAYRVAALNDTSVTALSPEVVIGSGGATLSTANYNVVSFAPVAGATSYRIYGRFAGDEAIIGTVASDGRSVNYTYSDQSRLIGYPPALGINVVPNASFATNTSLWNALNTSIARDLTHGQPVTGATPVLLTSTATSGAWAQSNASGTLQVPVVTAGTTYTFTIYVWLGTAPSVSLACQWFNSSAAVITSSTSSSVGTTTGWTRFTLTATAPASAAFANIFVGLNNTAVGQTAWFGGAQIDPGSTANAWASELPAASGGNQTEWRATGTAVSYVNAAGQLFDNGARVYSPNNPPPASGGSGSTAATFAGMAKFGAFS